MNYVYVISYDLNKSGQDYKGLYKELKNSTSWWHYLDSTWLIYTKENASALWDRISSHFDENDSCLIVRLQPGSTNRSGWLEQKAWDWITNHLG